MLTGWRDPSWIWASPTPRVSSDPEYWKNSGYEQAFDVELDDLCGYSCSLWIVQNLSCSATTLIRGGSRSKSIWLACNVPLEHRKCWVMTSVFRVAPTSTPRSKCSVSLHDHTSFDRIVSLLQLGPLYATPRRSPLVDPRLHAYGPRPKCSASLHDHTSFDRIVSLLQLGPPVCDAQTVPTVPGPSALRHCMITHRSTGSSPYCSSDPLYATPRRSPLVDPRLHAYGLRSKRSAPLHDHTSFDRIVSLLQLGPPVSDAQTVPTGRSPTPRLRSPNQALCMITHRSTGGSPYCSSLDGVWYCPPICASRRSTMLVPNSTPMSYLPGPGALRSSPAREILRMPRPQRLFTAHDASRLLELRCHLRPSSSGMVSPWVR
ncbi:hypothetical protein C8R46DRAFT_1231277 [Mycena filopes]|nr:hypothetical protein C8R46DRAFT_1231277 [Mycena filopes]